MQIQTQREQLLQLLQHVIGVVERRQTLPILANVLVVAEDDKLALTATDLEVELAAETALVIDEPGRITLPGRKLLDILRALPEAAAVALAVQGGGQRALLKSGRSRFSLTTLPAAELPTLESFAVEGQLRLPQTALRDLVERTHFAMAQQDVRYYLNGLLLEFRDNAIRAVATDGHRLALCEIEAVTDVPAIRQVIVPRKGIQELLRLLSGAGDAEAQLHIGSNHIQADLGAIRFTSKLIDGKFPDYQRAIPQESARVAIADRAPLRDALARAAILANENHGVRLQLAQGLLRIQANNPEQEEAEEELEIVYQGEPLEIGFNVGYLLDALAVLQGESVKLFFSDAGSSCLLRAAEEPNSKCVISPMRL
jgi:DNA polymerase-3 subunit beta